MMIDELSIRGNCWIGSSVIARKPTSTSARLTTMARTGRRTKTSIARMWANPDSVDRAGLAALGRIGHLDQQPLAQLERACPGDQLALGEPVGDDDVGALDSPVRTMRWRARDWPSSSTRTKTCSPKGARRTAVSGTRRAGRGGAITATTSTKAPGRRISPRPLAIARKRTARLVASMLASSATISAETLLPGICGPPRLTDTPGRIAAAMS